MRQKDGWPLLTLLGAITTISAECDREVVQGLALALGTTITTAAITDDEILQNVNTGMTYLESMSYQEIIDFETQLNEYELKSEIECFEENPKVYSKKQQL